MASPDTHPDGSPGDRSDRSSDARFDGSPGGSSDARPGVFQPGVSPPGVATAEGRAGLAALRASPGRSVVALDFDGTLAPIVADPDQARPHPDVLPALTRLAPRLRALVVITGRPAGLAVRYGGFDTAPGLENLTVLGAYGAERWDAGTGRLTAPPPDPGVRAVRAELPGLLRELAAPSGVRVEDKGLALAVHTRQAPDPAGAFAALRDPLATLAERHALHLEPGRFVLELRPGGMDKGRALTAFLAEKDAGPVLYAGDDLGDLAAFDAVAARRAGGTPGLLVCSGSTEVTALADRADLVVDGPPGVAAFLATL
ncbi:trehalose-phosphatase [Streptomyces sp. JJ66]|uniref:trehalose-phosphatase n=1 Tax=Streptomyces sp. JJ66 TaxID=2803843 RepID=UPI001C58AD61|nr:trehalose-phosphatase [Streptomyces sp. JJ66]MBW1602610.1 trehalose-phosphatase [Streptomyces sp. JJ66]